MDIKLREELSKCRHLVALLKDLYAEGYYGGIHDNEEKWFLAWTLAVEKIINGVEFSETLVMECFEEIKEN